MTYADIRWQIKTGDIFAVKGTGIAGSLIRILTGESFSHVALLVRQPEGIYVFEFVEGVGYQSMPASEWLRRRSGQHVYCAIGPRVLASSSKPIARAARRYRNSSVASRWYGWGSLVKVWISQIIGKKIHVHQKVCSTFVQECWEAGGFYLPDTTADPGDIVTACTGGAFPLAGGQKQGA